MKALNCETFGYLFVYLNIPHISVNKNCSSWEEIDYKSLIMDEKPSLM